MRFPTFVRFAIAGLLPTAMAQTWSGKGGTLWTSAPNWIGGLPANDGTANIIFSSPTSTRSLSTMEISWDVASIRWNENSLSAGVNVLAMNEYGGDLVKALTVRDGLTNASGGAVQVQANVVLAGDQVWDSGASLSVTGQLSGGGSLRKIGSGTLLLNDWMWHEVPLVRTGSTIIDAGVLQIGTSDHVSLGTGLLTINSATLKLGFYNLTQRVTVGGAAVIEASDPVTFSGGIDGNGSLALTGSLSSGSAQFNLGGTNTYAGGTTIDTARVTATDSERTFGLGNVTVLPNGVLTLQAATNVAAGKHVILQGGTLLLANPTIDPASMIDAAATTGGAVGLAPGTVSSVLNMAAIGNGKIFLGGNGDVTYAADALLPGAGNIYRLGGAGNLSLSKANVLTGTASVVVGQEGGLETGYIRTEKVYLNQRNNYSGGTTLNNIQLFIADDHALGSGPLTLKRGLLAPVPGAGARVIANDVFLPGGENPFGENTVYLGGRESLTFTGRFDLGGGTSAVAFDGSVTIAGSISNGRVHLAGGAVRLTGDNNAEFQISGGTEVEVERPENLHGSDVLTISHGLVIPTRSMTLNQDIKGKVITSNARAGFDIRKDIVLTLTGNISGDLDKVGAGTLIANGTVNQGQVNVRDGIFEMVGGARGGNVTLTQTGVLRGSGQLSSLYVYPGARVSPGGAGVGEFIVTDSGFFASNAILDFDLSMEASDRITLSGRFYSDSPRPAIVNINALGELEPGQTFTLIDWRNATPHPTTEVTETFRLGSSSVDGWLSVEDGTLRFTVVPEPGTIALLACSFIGLSCVWFRRCKI